MTILTDKDSQHVASLSCTITITIMEIARLSCQHSCLIVNG